MLKKVKFLFCIHLMNKGNVSNTFEPAYVISLTLPKVCMKEFKGKHYLGGRFVPA